MAGRLRYPAIQTPRTLPRDAQDAVSAIRQRIEAIESDLQAITSQAQAGLLALTKQLATVTTPTTTPTTTTAYAAAASVSAFSAVFLASTSQVAPSDPTLLASSFGCFGVATSAAPPGGKVQVATAGQVVTIQGAGFSPFLPVFAGVAGVLTQAPPAAAAIIQVGVAISATALLVAPAPTLLNAVSLTGVEDDFLPIARNPGVGWQLNGVLIGTRRNVQFLTPGLGAYAYDDPGNNRVVIVLGQSGLSFGANPLEDAWPWDLEELEDDTVWWGIDDLVQGNNSVPSAGLVEDAWDWSFEELPDEGWFLGLDEQAGRRGNVGLQPVDDWDWSIEELPDEAWFLGLDDVVARNTSAQLAGPVEDGWPWDELEPEDTPWPM